MIKVEGAKVTVSGKKTLVLSELQMLWNALSDSSMNMSVDMWAEIGKVAESRKDEWHAGLAKHQDKIEFEKNTPEEILKLFIGPKEERAIEILAEECANEMIAGIESNKESIATYLEKKLEEFRKKLK